MSIENSNDNDTNIDENVEPAAAPKQSTSNINADAAKEAAGNLLGNFLALKESNPKVFFGAIGGALALVILLVVSGGSEPKLPVHQSKPVVIGQSYVLKGANAYDPQATIRLVAVPGSMAAYDDTEEADRDGGCKHIKEGTPVKVTQSQDAYGKKDVFVEVEMLNGECEGKKGWALAVNLQ
ncbi:hypothetical protein [Methylomonas sp. AM2-LC]|uniref:hypothetical protein n=1 Tax=Methylomonas sp. AM2-LC TaxID=3153301 RepID=UPI003266E8F9